MMHTREALKAWVYKASSQARREMDKTPQVDMAWELLALLALLLQVPEDMVRPSQSIMEIPFTETNMLPLGIVD